MDEKPSCFVSDEMHEKVRQFMVSVVNDRNSVKATELITAVTVAMVDSESPTHIEGMKDLKPNCQLGDALNQVMEELIQQGELIELEYTTPNLDCRLRSLLFPKGTAFTNR